MKTILLACCLLAAGSPSLHAQDTASAPALTLEEYEKARAFNVPDLDKDTYIKFDNAYILDRGDYLKPYFITGDDSLKKRIDLYKLIRKQGRAELGTVIYYTTETGKRYSACLPGFNAGGDIWEKYFGDIHTIDKEEQHFALKLSYVLSRQLGIQLYKAANQGKNMSKDNGTYGNDICFPGDMQVEMADGSTRPIGEIRAGDEILTVNPATLKTTRVKVKELTTHAVKNYAITQLLLLASTERTVAAPGGNARGYHEVLLTTRWLEATPNHPVPTPQGNRKIGELEPGDKLVCRDDHSGSYRNFTVWYKTESAGGLQQVYNIVTAGGSTLVLNGVIVSQK